MPSSAPPARRTGASTSSQFATTTIFDHLAAQGAAGASALALSPFDACHVGVVMRAVLFVHAVLAIGVSFVASDVWTWLLAFAQGAAVAMPGTLLWLVVACMLKRPLARVSEPGQWLVATGLGALCGFYGWWQAGLVGLELHRQVPPIGPLAGGATLAAALFYALRLRSRSELPAVTAARLAELQSRIRPHFLFNTLNTAIALVRIDPGRAESVLEDLAELFRVALIESGSSVTLAEEVELAQRYLAIEEIRFGKRLKVSWDIDPAAGRARVPPLLLQPLVENAVRHGIEPAAQGGWVRVRTGTRRGQALISVSNSLPPADHPGLPGHGIALRNVKERLRLMHDLAAQFAAGPERNTWRVHVVVPLD
ncbi:histidine kinase [Aquabacterium sp. A7-Y]|uniref:sensor histidine kinase n=1 Tax=Aquabacterium sp. A7-Y TaxID=1349605 RepID=UPI00223E68C8|nr:histidine kinase [Aquabacterium sp. A7-Y]MCW7538658.1 histidine kinase [Aquabacterium sp. A7-Y]